jgi:hypothetical protein
MTGLTYEPPQSASADMTYAESEVRRLTDMLKLIAATDQAAGGNISEAEAWRQAQRLARDALRGAYVEGDTSSMDLFVCQEELRERDAMLSGLLDSIYKLDGHIQSTMILKGYVSNSVREWFNETKAGVTWERLEAWWADHKAQDEARRQAEAQAQACKREAALAKLTLQERKLLGV